MCGYLCYCHVPVSFNQSGPSPLTSLISIVFLPAELLLTWCFLFFAPFSANSRDCCVWKSEEISSFWDTQTLSSTNNHSTVKLRRSHLFPILSEKQVNLLIMSACFCATWLADKIYALTRCCSDLSNKLVTECTFFNGLYQWLSIFLALHHWNIINDNIKIINNCIINKKYIMCKSAAFSSDLNWPLFLTRYYRLLPCYFLVFVFIFVFIEIIIQLLTNSPSYR